MPEEPRQHQAGPSGQRERREAPPGGPRKGKRQYFRKKKVCRFCVDRVDFIDYKKVEMLQAIRAGARQDPAAAHDRHLLEHQRWLGEAIKRRAQHCAAAVCHCTLGTWSGASIEFWELPEAVPGVF